MNIQNFFKRNKEFQLGVFHFKNLSFYKFSTWKKTQFPAIKFESNAPVYCSIYNILPSSGTTTITEREETLVGREF